MQATGALAADLMKGAAAGAAGVWLMDRFDWLMVEHGDREAWRRTQAVRPHGRDPAHNMAGSLSEAMGGGPLGQPHPAGIAVHYALGVVPGMLYAPLRHRLRVPGVGRGLLYGLALFLVNDELLNPVLGLAAGPTAYPWQAHARGLVAHLVLGVATEAALDAPDRVA